MSLPTRMRSIKPLNSFWSQRKAYDQKSENTYYEQILYLLSLPKHIHHISSYSSGLFWNPASAPSFKNNSVVARPIPLEPPVTNALRPWGSINLHASTLAGKWVFVKVGVPKANGFPYYPLVHTLTWIINLYLHFTPVNKTVIDSLHPQVYRSRVDALRFNIVLIIVIYRTWLRGTASFVSEVVQ